MSGNYDNFSRRDLLKVAGAAGVGSLLAAGEVFAGEDAAATVPATKPPDQTVPRRAYGKTGLTVPILALGGVFDITQNQLMLKMALKYGIDYWDTAHGYVGGKSEEGMGMFFERNGEKRKKIFLVTKAPARDTEGIERQVRTSLERMKTDYIDMLFIHHVRSGRELRDHADQWKALAEKFKAEKTIRFFGLSTHKNMADCLKTAAGFGWIDAIMTTYNFRVMASDEMKAAVDACAKAGIGLTAMKTQARKAKKIYTDADSEIGEQLLDRGFTPAQANLKMVWADTRITTICSAMYSIPVLQSNVAAAKDKTALSATDKRRMAEYARATCSGYCAGCASNCEPAVGEQVPVADVMRYLMYYNEYGDRDMARELFGELPATVRRRVASADYSVAERRCPQHLPIGQLMREATRLLA